MTSGDQPNSTSSAGSRAGRPRSAPRAGQTTGPCSRARFPASPSLPLADEPDSAMSATSGPRCSVSSASADLSASLASKLRAVTDQSGSPLYALTWKWQAMPSGPPIPLLRATVRRTSGNGCTGWPTCAARDWRDGRSNQHGKNARPLNEVACLAGWPTPTAANAEQGGQAERMQGGSNLQDAVMLAPGPTPNGCTAETASGGPTAPAHTPSPSLSLAHSAWLMNIPPAWMSCAPSATAWSSRKRKRS